MKRRRARDGLLEVFREELERCKAGLRASLCVASLIGALTDGETLAVLGVFPQWD